MDLQQQTVAITGGSIPLRWTAPQDMGGIGVEQYEVRLNQHVQTSVLPYLQGTSICVAMQHALLYTYVL